MKTMFRLFAVIASSVTAVHGGNTTLNFGTLPSAQGWSYSGSGPDGAVFTVSGEVLTQNSLGIGGNPAYYRLNDAVNPTLRYSIAFEGRLLENEVIFPEDPRAYAVQMDLVSQAVGVGLSSQGVVVFGPSGQTLLFNNSIDTSKFHLYMLQGRPQDRTWELFVDGTRLGDGITEQGSFPNAVYFGDLTDGENARGEWAGLSVHSETRGQSGALDTTFDASALVGSVLTIAMQSDSGILVGGKFTSPETTTVRNVARLHPDGSIDRSFNTGTGPNDLVTAIAFQSDGKVLIGGSFTQVDGVVAPGIARLHSNGSVDPTFTADPVLDGDVRSIKVQADGSVLVAGSVPLLGGPSHRCLVRLYPDGRVDESFVVHIEPVYVDLGGINSIELLPDGRIYVTGLFAQINGQESAGLARLHATGTIDNTFAFAGTYGGNSLALQPDGKIIVGGQSQNNLVRVNPDGSIDGTFNVPLESGSDPVVNTIALQQDGKVLLGGVGLFLHVDEPPSAYDQTLVRVEPDGSPDEGFFSGVQVGSHGYASALSVLPDGKILVGVSEGITPLFRLMNPPSLSISSSAGAIVLRWPGYATDFTLEATPALSTPDWQPVTENPVISDGMFSVTLPTDQPIRFFRLKEQP